MRMLADATCPRRRIAHLFALFVLVLTVVALAVLFLAPPDALGQTGAAPAGSRPGHGAQASAAEPTSAAAAPGQARTTSAAARPGGGLSQGITVHGHWVIEVRNPDGKLVSHTEFENSLKGQFLLATLLSGFVMGDWMVVLDGAGGDTQEPCTNPASPGAVPCGIGASGGYFMTTQCPGILLQCFPTLTLLSAFDPPTEYRTTVTVQGTATASATGAITDVETLINVCYPSSTATDCQTTASELLTSGTFTAATLPASNTPSTPCGGTGEISCAVPVSAGQVINVSVTLSFQ